MLGILTVRENSSSLCTSCVLVDLSSVIILFGFEWYNFLISFFHRILTLYPHSSFFCPSFLPDHFSFHSISSWSWLMRCCKWRSFSIAFFVNECVIDFFLSFFLAWKTLQTAYGIIINMVLCMFVLFHENVEGSFFPVFILLPPRVRESIGFGF